MQSGSTGLALGLIGCCMHAASGHCLHDMLGWKHVLRKAIVMPEAGLINQTLVM